MRVALYFVIIGMGWWSLGWGCCVVRVELVCWRLIWFQCHYLVGWLVMLCSLVSFLWWLVRGCGVVIMVLNWNCRDCDCVLGDCGGYVLCCDLNGGVGFVWSWFVISCLIVIPLGVHLLWCVFCGQESVVILNDSWDLGDLHSLCWSKLWGDYCWVVVILDSWVGVVSCDSWGGFGGVSGWFAYDRDLVRCRGWGFVLVSILSAFVAYVVIWLVFWGWLVGSRWRFVF